MPWDAWYRVRRGSQRPLFCSEFFPGAWSRKSRSLRTAFRAPHRRSGSKAGVEPAFPPGRLRGYTGSGAGEGLRFPSPLKDGFG